MQFHQILSFLRDVQFIGFGIKTIDALIEVTAEYASKSCMYYVSRTCYPQVSLFLLYVFAKVAEFVLFCVMF